MSTHCEAIKNNGISCHASPGKPYCAHGFTIRLCGHHSKSMKFIGQIVQKKQNEQRQNEQVELETNSESVWIEFLPSGNVLLPSGVIPLPEENESVGQQQTAEKQQTPVEQQTPGERQTSIEQQQSLVEIPQAKPEQQSQNIQESILDQELRQAFPVPKDFQIMTSFVVNGITLRPMDAWELELHRFHIYLNGH